MNYTDALDAVDVITERLVRLAGLTPDAARECAKNAAAAVCTDEPYDYGIAPALVNAIWHRAANARTPGYNPEWRFAVERVIRRHAVAIDLDAVSSEPRAQWTAAIDWLATEATRGLE